MRSEVSKGLEGDLVFYRIRFRREGQEFTAVSQIAGLVRDEVVMVRTDHGFEPAIVISSAPLPVGIAGVKGGPPG